MKGKIKYIIFIIIVCISIILSFRYKEINKDSPNAYEKQVYKVNELVELDNLEFKINSYDIIRGKEETANDKIILNIEMKNKSPEKLDIKTLISNSKLSDGFEYLDAPGVDEKDLKKIQGLAPGEVLEATIYYSSAPNRINFDNGLQFYIANDLYKTQIRERYDERKFYAKYIELKWIKF